MEFKIKEIYKEKLEEELKKYEVIVDNENELILCHRLDKSGLVIHNILYKNTNFSMDDQSRRIEVVGDLTGNFELYIKSTTYGLVDKKYVEVETEKAGCYLVYKHDNDLLEKYYDKNNVFPFLKELEKRKDLIIKSESNFVYRNKSNGYGTDEICDSNFEKIGTLSSSHVSLDDMFKKAKERRR